MQTLAVVPIFISAGSALLPTVLAAVGGALAVLLRPRELVGLVRRRPGMTAIVLLAIIAITTAAWAYEKHARATPPKAPAIDWPGFARQLIAAQQLAAIRATQPTTQSTKPEATDIVEARTFARTSADNGPSPANLKTLWTYAPADTMFLSTPAVAGDRIYVAGCVADLGSYTGLLACLDAGTGRVIWEATEAAGEPLMALFSSPAVSADGQSVVIGQGFHTDKNCNLLCFDTANGKLRWQAKSTEHIESSPAIRGDFVVVGVGAIEDKAGRPTGNPGHALAVKLSTGDVLWRHPVIDAESSPAIGDDGTVYIGSGLNGRAIVAINADGTEKWRTPLENNCTATITLADGLVIAGSGNGDFAHSGADARGAAVALDMATGKLRWKAEFADTILGPVAVRDGLAIAPIRTGELVAIDVATGQIKWKTEISRASPMLAGAAVSGDRVYALAADATLAVIDRSTGQALEKHAMANPAKPGEGLSSAAPQLANGRLYVASETGGVKCLVGTVDEKGGAK